jgi:hypothetical protein
VERGKEGWHRPAHYIAGGVPDRSMKFRGVEEAVSRSAILLHNECWAQASEAPIERAVLFDMVAHNRRGSKGGGRERGNQDAVGHDMKAVT